MTVELGSISGSMPKSDVKIAQSLPHNLSCARLRGQIGRFRILARLGYALEDAHSPQSTAGPAVGATQQATPPLDAGAGAREEVAFEQALFDHGSRPDRCGFDSSTLARPEIQEPGF